MELRKIHFLYDPNKEESAALAEKLIADLGQTDIKRADIIVTVGGDGLLLQALREAHGKQAVYAITPSNSNSHGFWTDHSVKTSAELLSQIKKARAVSLVPLKANIRFANGNQTVRLAFNDVAIERATGQAVLINLTAVFSKEASESLRIMGDGFVFSTALGSTGTNRSYGGPAIDITNNVIILTGKGIYEPRGTAPVVANADGTIFRIDFGSVAHKRPVRIDYDGLSIESDEKGSPIAGLTISTAPEHAVDFLLTSEPGLRIFSAMRP